MSNWRKVFQGLIILAIFFGMLGAIVSLAPGFSQSLTRNLARSYDRPTQGIHPTLG